MRQNFTTYLFFIAVLVLPSCGKNGSGKTEPTDSGETDSANSDGDSNGDTNSDSAGDTHSDSAKDTGSDSAKDTDSDADTDTATALERDTATDSDSVTDTESAVVYSTCEESPCDEHATCEMKHLSPSGPECTCLEGWEGDGFTCVDIDECLVDNGGCPYYFDCINEPGGVSCKERDSCLPGMTGTPKTGCFDINECAVDNGGCDSLSPCFNTLGGFSCGDCPPGYEGDGKTGCSDVNPDVAPDCIFYANAESGDDLNDGKSWESAKQNLYTAIETAAESTCVLSEVWATAGTYYTKPDFREASTILMVEGVNVFGGFAGNETVRSQRDFTTNVSIISGNIRAEDDETDNAMIVVSGVENTVIDGFTIQDGYGGAGMYKGVAANCTFYKNQVNKGGGMYYGVAINCLFLENSAAEGGGMYGGTAINCVFEANTATLGGGIFGASDPEGSATNCRFLSNIAGEGGGMYGGIADNCTFESNRATKGGGMIVGTAKHSRFSQNSAENGGGAQGTVVFDTIFDSNTAEAIGGGMCEGVATRSVFHANSSDGAGGGVDHSDVTDCLFMSNTAVGDGGGFHTFRDENKAVGSTFVANTAKSGGGMYGGIATDCHFSLNSAETGGGVNQTELRQSMLASNVAQAAGGGMFSTTTPDYFTDIRKYAENSVFVTNQTGGDGGGIQGGGAKNCTIISNRGDEWDNTFDTLALNCIMGDGRSDALSSININAHTDASLLTDYFKGFPLLSSTVSAVSYDDTTFKTTLAVVMDVPLEPESLIGLLIQPDAANPWWFEIVDNSAGEIVVYGDVRNDINGDPFVEAGDTFNVYDLHLKEDSPAIDAGECEGAPFQDKEGRYRTDNPDVENTGQGPAWVDMGAYETGDGKDAICGEPIFFEEQKTVFYLCEEEMTGDEAEAYCQGLAYKGHLACPENAAETEFMESLANEERWIGLVEINNEGNWGCRKENFESYFWSDSWAADYPTTDFEISCGYMGAAPDRLWRDDLCEDQRRLFICEAPVWLW